MLGPSREKKNSLMWNYIAVAVGGAVGCLARYGLTRYVQAGFGTGFPLATLLVNVSGSFALGFVCFLAADRLALSPTLRLGLMTGVLGGYTTYSTFMLETLALGEGGSWAKAGLYLLLSVVLGLAAVIAGAWLARSL